MTTPNEAAKTEQTAEQEPEGIRRMREDYSPEKVGKILASVRQSADNPNKGQWMTLEELIEKQSIRSEDVEP